MPQEVDTTGTGSKADSYQASLYHQVARVSFGGAYQQGNQQSTPANTSWSVGVAYDADSYALRLFYLNTLDHVTQNQANAVRKDSTIGLGASKHLTHALLLSGAAYFDTLSIDEQSGRHSTVMAMLDYSFSKYTAVYATADYSWASDAGLNDLNDDLTQTRNARRTGFAVGLPEAF